MNQKALDRNIVIKAVIFDFDCTLANTIDMMVEAKKRALTALGVEPPAAEFLRSLTVMLIRDSIAMVPGVRSGAIADEITTLYHDYMMDLSSQGCPLFPGVTDTLEALGKRGIKTGVVSLRPHSHLDRVLKVMKLDRLIDAWVGEGVVKNGKPATDMVDYLMNILDVPAENTLVVGDTLYDLEMGHNAGTYTGACMLGEQPESVLRGINPDMIFHDYNSFLRLTGLAV